MLLRFHVSKRTLVSVDEKLGRWGNDKVFDVAGVTRISSTGSVVIAKRAEKLPSSLLFKYLELTLRLLLS